MPQPHRIATRLWPNAEIPFEIEPGLAASPRIRDAMRHWEINTRIRFVARTAANAGQFPDYVRIRLGNTAFSAIGRAGGRQDLFLPVGFRMGNVIHEIGHATGRWHEHCRDDAGQFVRIIWSNIFPQLIRNFAAAPTGKADLGTDYDYGSIMHYALRADSLTGGRTIEPIQPVPAGVTIGQRLSLSAGDIRAANHMYPAP